NVGVSNFIGSPGNDTITGNNLNGTIQGSALDNPDPYALPAVPPTNPQTQWVYLDFKDFPAPPTSEVDPDTGKTVTISESLHNGTGVYTTADQQAILAGLQNIYKPFISAAFNLVQFT